MGVSMGPKPLSPISLILFSCFSITFLLYSCSCSQEEQVGYGYTVGSVVRDPSERWLSAELSVIEKSSVYGDDIENLNLVARWGGHTTSVVIVGSGTPKKDGELYGMWYGQRMHEHYGERNRRMFTDKRRTIPYLINDTALNLRDG